MHDCTLWRVLELAVFPSLLNWHTTLVSRRLAAACCQRVESLVKCSMVFGTA